MDQEIIYFDNAATSFPKPQSVIDATVYCMKNFCGNSGRGSHIIAMRSAQAVYDVREDLADMFSSTPENVVFTLNTTYALNMAIKGIMKGGGHALISNMEHNSVLRPIHSLSRTGKVNYDIFPVYQNGRACSKKEIIDGIISRLRPDTRMLVCVHSSNICSYTLPILEIGQLCRRYGILFVLDAAQSAGTLAVSLKKWDADFIAMPGHKGLLGPQGTGLLLCGRDPKPLLFGGTGSNSREQKMPEFLPDRLEAGTLNVPGIAGLDVGVRYVNRISIREVFHREHTQLQACVHGLKKMGFRVFSGDHQAATVSFLPEGDCEEFAERLGHRGVAVRAGIHCAPLAHESAGTLSSGTVRISFGYDASDPQTGKFLRILQFL